MLKAQIDCSSRKAADTVESSPPAASAVSRLSRTCDCVWAFTVTCRVTPRSAPWTPSPARSAARSVDIDVPLTEAAKDDRAETEAEDVCGSPMAIVNLPNSGCPFRLYVAGLIRIPDSSRQDAAPACRPRTAAMGCGIATTFTVWATTVDSVGCAGPADESVAAA